jgi:isoleucyl-tRNA synthetase
MLARTRDLTEKVRDWYASFEFHRVYHAVNEFAIVDLSSFYLDVLKDRMYTFAPSCQARRSAQTVLWQITEALTRLVAPILSFTADEVWDYLPAVEGREASVHLAQFPTPEEVFAENPSEMLEKWKRLLTVRDEVMSAIELERKQGRIGKGLGARVEIHANAADAQLLSSFPPGTLEEFFNVSQVEVRTTKGANNEDAALAPPAAIAFPAAGLKCNRCWRFTEDTADYGIWQNVCARCQNALKEMGIAPPAPVAEEAAQ